MKPADLRLGLVGPVPPPNGGMAMQTRQLAALLAADGVHVKQVATNAPCRPRWVSRVPLLRALFRLVPYLLAVWRLTGRVDVIHLMANSGWSWQLYAAPVLWIAWLRKTPVIVNYRGGEAQAYFQRSFSRVWPSLQKAALVVVPSGYLEAVFAGFGQTVRVIPNIVDRSVFRPQHGARENKRYTLVITRNLEAIYGIETAIRALARVRETSRAVQLRIAGSGPQEVYLRRLVRSLGLEQAVRFEGRLEREAVVALYARADAMLNPSLVDNMPNSIIEALSCAVPVISTDVGGVPYVVAHEETALLVPQQDPDKLADAILRLRNDTVLQQRLRANGLAQVEQYTWASVRNQWLDAYAQVVCQQRAAAL